jgi:flagellar protein FlaJ
MIYPVGMMALVGLAFIVMLVTAAGAWIIFMVSPHEVKTHRLPRRSAEQQRMESVGVILVTLTGPVMTLLTLFVNLGVAMLAASVMLTPLAYLAWLDDKKIDGRDRDLAVFLRGLGNVMGAVGTTVTEGLSRLNRRSLGAMEPHVRRLFVRLSNDISPELTWTRLAGESGSELVTRTVRIFSEAIRLGGDPAVVGNLAAGFAMKVSLLRQSRALVATTFSFVIVPMHAALLGILLFVSGVVGIFGEKISEVQDASLNSDIVRDAGVSTAIAFAAPDMTFMNVFISLMILMLTVANSFAAYAAGGGHRFKLFIYACVMLAISGAALLVVPAVVEGLFRSVSEIPGSG